jgi:hypothetical protein
LIFQFSSHVFQSVADQEIVGDKDYCLKEDGVDANIQDLSEDFVTLLC